MPRHRIRSIVLTGLATAGLAGCLTSAPDLADPEGIGFRAARYREAQTAVDWRACRDEGVALDRAAGQAGAPARHLAAARVLESCEAGLGDGAAALPPEERMRAYGLAIQARLKGGDPAGARVGLERFRAAFPDRDLYFEDGTSFLDTIAAVLAVGAGDRLPAGTANLDPAVGGELRRLAHWRRA